MSDYRDPNDPTWRNAAYDPNARGYSSTWGWVIGALFVLGVLVIAFGTKHEGSQTASNDVSPPAATRMTPPGAKLDPAHGPSGATAFAGKPGAGAEGKPIALGNSTSSPSRNGPAHAGPFFFSRAGSNPTPAAPGAAARGHCRRRFYENRPRRIPGAGRRRDRRCCGTENPSRTRSVRSAPPWSARPLEPDG